ncbi:alpha/beta hydrolase family protein [Paenarthrobacter sp. 2TAF44]|uniref:alpha/beta hydrolase family protein n=1 Tax=Paenarthrobacter sp. 2TAF44 TaxID=3233018 RepID=UPI003F9E73EB
MRRATSHRTLRALSNASRWPPSTQASKAPAMLVQGEHDSLFPLNQAVATYQALKRQGTPVKMMWISHGHDSTSMDAPGELTKSNPSFTTDYVMVRFAYWFDHYLKGGPKNTGPEFEYMRDWVAFAGSAAPPTAAHPPTQWRTPSTYIWRAAEHSPPTRTL